MLMNHKGNEPEKTSAKKIDKLPINKHKSIFNPFEGFCSNVLMSLFEISSIYNYSLIKFKSIFFNLTIILKIDNVVRFIY